MDAVINLENGPKRTLSTHKKWSCASVTAFTKDAFISHVQMLGPPVPAIYLIEKKQQIRIGD